jgi:hypothetical protein
MFFMCNVWIEQIHNWSNTTFTLNTDDGTWWPVIDGHKFRGGQYRDPIAVPPGAGMNCQYFLIPFIEWGRLQITGPQGSAVKFAVGPVMADGQDYLRGLTDPQEQPLLQAAVGPQGSNFWAPSVTMHLHFGPSESEGVRFLPWSANRVGPDLLQALGEALLQAEGGIWQALIRAAPAPAGG